MLDLVIVVSVRRRYVNAGRRWRRKMLINLLCIFVCFVLLSTDDEEVINLSERVNQGATGGHSRGECEEDRELLDERFGILPSLQKRLKKRLNYGYDWAGPIRMFSLVVRNKLLSLQWDFDFDGWKGKPELVPSSDEGWFVHLLRGYIGALLHERSDCEPEGVEHWKLVLQHYRVTTSARMRILPLVGREPTDRWVDDDIEDFVKERSRKWMEWRGKKNNLSSNGNKILLLSLCSVTWPNKYFMSLSLLMRWSALYGAVHNYWPSIRNDRNGGG